MVNSVKVEAVEELHGIFSRAKSAVVDKLPGYRRGRNFGITCSYEKSFSGFSCCEKYLGS